VPARTDALTVVASGPEKAAKMLLEAHARFLRSAGGVGIQGQQKILDLLTHLDVAWKRSLTRLDVMLHFPIHFYSPRRNLSWLSLSPQTTL
jgi:hypothetical protein